MGVAEHFSGGTRLFETPVMEHEDAVGDVLYTPRSWETMMMAVLGRAARMAAKVSRI